MKCDFPAKEMNVELLNANKQDIMAVRSNVSEAIETVSEGVALFDPGDQLVLWNSRFWR